MAIQFKLHQKEKDAAFLGRLLEKAPLDLEGKKWRVVLIRAGWSKNNRYYPKEALQRALPLFEGLKAFAYSFGVNKQGDEIFDHISDWDRPEGGAVKNIVGWYENVQLEESGEVTADFIVCAKWLQETLMVAWAEGKQDLLGFSIDGTGNSEFGTAEGRQGEIVTDLVAMAEVTVVDDPAAGGRLLKLVASARLHHEQKINNDIKEDTKVKDYLVKSILKYAESGKFAEANLMEKTEEELKAILDEVMESVKAAIPTADKKETEEPPPAKEEVKPAEEPTVKDALAEAKKILAAASEKDKEVDKELHKLKVSESRNILKESIADSQLPEPIQDRIKEDFEGKVFTREDVDSRIEREKDTLAKLSESGKIKNLGDQRVDDVQVGAEREDRLQAAMDKICGVKEPIAPNGAKIHESAKKIFEAVEIPRSLKKLYGEITGDYDVTGSYPRTGRLSEATTSDFSYILGTSLTRKMVQDYRMMIANIPWKEFCDIVPVDNFKSQERIRWRGLADLETVTESDSTDYPDIAFPGDEEATYTPFTKGGILTITRRMIKNDDLRSLGKMGNKAAQAAYRTLMRFIFDLILNVSSGTINGGTVYDSLALYHANHGNLISTALGYDALFSLKRKMRQQAEYGYATTIAEDLDNSEAGVDVATDKGANFKSGDVVKVDAEEMYVSSVTTDTLTVTRGYNGTTAATHSNGAAIYIITDDLGLKLGYLLHPDDLDGTVAALLNSEKRPSGNNNDNNEHKGSFVPIPLGRFARNDANNYYGIADPIFGKGIEIGFIDGKEEPELLIQDAPGVGEVFNKDVIRHKVRHEYGGAVIDWRYFAAAIVS